MKINAKESRISLFMGTVLAIVYISILVNGFFTILKTMIMNKGTIIVLFTIILVIIFQVYKIIILTISDNFHLILDDKYIMYKSFFIDIKEEYKEIKYMKLIRKPIRSFGGQQYILKIKIRKRNIYISIASKSSKQYRALKGLLIKRTGRMIAGDNKKAT